MKQVHAVKRSFRRVVGLLSIAALPFVGCRTDSTPRAAEQPSPGQSTADISDLRVRIDSVRCFQDLTPEGVRTRDQTPTFSCYARLILDNRNRIEPLEGLSIPTSMLIRRVDAVPIGTLQWQTAWNGAVAEGQRDTIELVSDHIIFTEDRTQTICDEVYSLMIVIAQSGRGNRTAVLDSVYLYCLY